MPMGAQCLRTIRYRFPLLFRETPHRSIKGITHSASFLMYLQHPLRLTQTGSEVKKYLQKTRIHSRAYPEARLAGHCKPIGPLKGWEVGWPTAFFCCCLLNFTAAETGLSAPNASDTGIPSTRIRACGSDRHIQLVSSWICCRITPDV